MDPSRSQLGSASTPRSEVGDAASSGQVLVEKVERLRVVGTHKARSRHQQHGYELCAVLRLRDALEAAPEHVGEQAAHAVRNVGWVELGLVHHVLVPVQRGDQPAEPPVNDRIIEAGRERARHGRPEGWDRRMDAG